jgi:hypothetical protein
LQKETRNDFYQARRDGIATQHSRFRVYNKQTRKREATIIFYNNSRFAVIERLNQFRFGYMRGPVTMKFAAGQLGKYIGRYRIESIAY